MSASTGVQGSWKPQNIIWAGTVFLNISSDILKQYPDKYFDTPPESMQYIVEKFYLKVGIRSSTILLVSLIRKLVDPQIRPDVGFYFEVCFTLLGSRQPPAIRLMKNIQDKVTVIYHMDLIKSKKSGPWTLKCCIKMIEFCPVQNEAFKQQNRMLIRIAAESGMHFLDSCKLAYLLEHTSLHTVFSGRQNAAFAEEKCHLIKRILPFWKELAEKHSTKLKPKQYYETITHLNDYMGWIVTDHGKNFYANEIAILYLWSFQFGLEFLKSECMEFMLKTLDNESIVDYLIVADIVQHECLMNALLDAFLYERHAIMDSQRWKTLVHQSLTVVKSIVDAAIRREKSGEYKVHRWKRSHTEGWFHMRRASI